MVQYARQTPPTLSSWSEAKDPTNRQRQHNGKKTHPRSSPNGMQRRAPTNLRGLHASVIIEDMPVLKNVAAIAKGMSITFMEMFQPTTVENYPDGPGPLKGAMFQERFRGVHVLQRDENGLEKCVACFLCAASCPSNCIYIEAAENTAEHRVSGAERYAKVYNIDYNRCIFCGYCVEACPTDAVRSGTGS